MDTIKVRWQNHLWPWAATGPTQLVPENIHHVDETDDTHGVEQLQKQIEPLAVQL